MALRGNLRDFSLPDVFQLVTLSGKTGVLRIKRPDAEGSIWFRDGEIFFAQSDWHREPLGTRLVAANKITPSALQKALDKQKSAGPDGPRLGAVLVDEGYITQTVLEAFVQEQIQDTIFDLFRWNEGDFDFEPLDSSSEEDIGLSVSIENVVMEGSRRLDEWNRIKKKIPSMEIVFKMATAPGEGTFDISLKPSEWNLLLKVDGTRSVSELARDFGRTDFEVSRVIYGLFSAGLLEVATDEEVAKLRAERAEHEARVAQTVGEAAPVAVPAESAPAAEAPAAEAPAATEPVAPVAEPVAAKPAEEPAFLGGGSGTASAADMAVFEAMMGAVLQVPAEAAPAGVAEVAETSAGPAVEAVAGTPYVVEAEPEEDYLSGFLGQATVETAAPAEEAVTLAEAPGEEPAAEAAAPAEELDLEAMLASAGPIAEETPPTEAPEAVEVAPDFESGLLALGLGELPTDLVAPVVEGAPEMAEAPAEAAEAVPAEAPPVAEEGAEAPAEEAAGGAGLPAHELEAFGEPAAVEATSDAAIGVVEPASVAGTAETPPAPAEEFVIPSDEEVFGEEPAEDSSDLTDLLSSLEADAGEAPVVLDTSAVGLDLGTAVEVVPVEAAPATGGMISTDAYLADFGTTDLSFSSGMTDEIAALTGGGVARSRPQATAKKIPESSDGSPTLHRDQQVDRALVEKIIDGVRNL